MSRPGPGQALRPPGQATGCGRNSASGLRLVARRHAVARPGSRPGPAPCHPTVPERAVPCPAPPTERPPQRAPAPMPRPRAMGRP